MNLPEQPEYALAIPAAVKGDYETARKNLQILILRARDDGDRLNTAFLLHVLGDIEAQDGNPEIGHTYHQEAIVLHENHPLPHLMYAEGLLRAFGRPDLAMQELQKLKEILDSGKLEEGADEKTLEWYETEHRTLTEQVNKQIV